MEGVQSAALYSQVADRLVALIERGTLRPGDRLPSLRRTCSTERVSLSTSLQAYALLEMRGYVEARPQSGFYVRPHASRDTLEPRAVSPRRAASWVDVADGAARVLRSAQDPRLVPLGAACPSPALLPTRALARLVASVARSGLADTNSYSFPPGRLELRREIARRALAWGGSLTPDDVLVTCGATEALSLALMATTRRGDVVAVETPTYFGTRLLLETLGLRAVEVATDPRDGLDVEALAQVLQRQKVAAVIASPTCQNPLGSIMPERSGQALAALLARHDVPLIEDDVYGEACHDGKRPAPVKAWDRNGRVILCSSFSKVLAPGYRIRVDCRRPLPRRDHPPEAGDDAGDARGAATGDRRLPAVARLRPLHPQGARRLPRPGDARARGGGAVLPGRDAGDPAARRLPVVDRAAGRRRQRAARGRRPRRRHQHLARHPVLGRRPAPPLHPAQLRAAVDPRPRSGG